ncbi:hypothetical protein JM18_004859 [Phytophthora kernoviae]|uniref:TRAM domain-containing protein n=2 Tax=Phytophthora kernoviae TaxID=325452 RepID=A0A8T0LZ88_9STRA|nr:hypothetical protein G195_006159 [Phytophthora kernoviae 00238/432]KAG2523550.1 hypothetical protein JM16_005295 [Phytophthora kernoviae]KAG2525440.1 hypothetical protein JM18_004859 [Phytophthora kernoviae]
MTTRLLDPRLQRSAASACRLLSTTSSPPATIAKRPIALTIDRLNAQGDGVGSYTSDQDVKMQVVVPFSARGDELQVDIWTRDVEMRDKWTAGQNNKQTWPLFGQQVEISRPSPHRVKPLCTRYFGVCGGCTLQHMIYEQQLKEKQGWVQELFAGRRHSPDAKLLDILGVETAEGGAGTYHYRNKMEFTCSTGRWLLDEDKPEDESETTATPRYPFTVGLFPTASVGVRRAKQVGGKGKGRRRRGAAWNPRILSLDQCLLQDSACNNLLKKFVTRCEDAGLQAYNFTSHEGFVKQVVLRRGVSDDGRTEIMLGLVTTTFSGEQSELLSTIVHDIVHEYERDFCSEESDSPRLVSIVESLDSEAQRHRGKVEWPKQERVLFGRSHLEDSILGHRFEISFDSFFQPNSVQAGVLYGEIQRMMASLPEKPVVWDLFCGVGSIGICMGAHAKKVVGFELVEVAVERAKVNARLNDYSPDHMQFFCVDLAKNWDEEKLLAKIAGEGNLPDVVIVDPPRAGLHKKLIKMLRRLSPRYICYVSCNPHSQVPDLETLCGPEKPEAGEVGSYRMKHLQPVDMLPHTPHIETIAWLERCD